MFQVPVANLRPFLTQVERPHLCLVHRDFSYFCLVTDQDREKHLPFPYKIIAFGRAATATTERLTPEQMASCKELNVTSEKDAPCSHGNRQNIARIVMLYSSILHTINTMIAMIYMLDSCVL